MKSSSGLIHSQTDVNCFLGFFKKKTDQKSKVFFKTKPIYILQLLEIKVPFNNFEKV